MQFNIRNTFSALQYRNFRLFITGQAISRIGTWMERTTVSWVVYDITHSTFMLGVVAFASQFPSFLFSLYGGIVSDRYNRQKIVLITQIAFFIEASILAILILFGDTNVWHILLIITSLGIINSFDVPARQALIHDLVDEPEDVSNAVALNSSIVNIARLAGPALSGIIISTVGAGICFSINAVSYLAVITSLLLIKYKKHTTKTKKQSNLKELKDGIVYLKNEPKLFLITIYIAIVSLLILPYDTLLAAFAKTIFHGNARTYGTLASCIGIGALTGTIFLASLKDGNKRKKVLTFSAALLGVSLIAFSFIHITLLAYAIAVIMGFSALTQTTICLTVIQTQTISEMRGRIISLYAMAMFGMLPLGGLLVGSVSHRIGSPNTILIQGFIAILVSIVFYRIFNKIK